MKEHNLWFIEHLLSNCRSHDRLVPTSELTRLIVLDNLSQPQQVRSSGKLQLYLQNYEFDRQPRPLTEPQGQGSNFNLTVPLSFSQNYVPQWKMKKVFGQKEIEASTTVRPLGEEDNTVVQWPWQEETECSSPTRYRFVVCLDYEGSFDPSYPCSLERVETDLLPIDRALPFVTTERLTFRTLLRAGQGTDIIPNPFEVQFDVWKGPVRLSVFITCCGAASVFEGQCNEVLTSTISAWPRAATAGTQTLRYRLSGRGSMNVIANAVCDENYFSHSCDIFCQVENPGTEHAFCNGTTGARQCLAGYEGPECQTDVDECLTQSTVCKNGGVCRNSLGSFSCSCPFGTTGRQCDQRYPVCHLRPCQHQGTCVETASGSLCLCMPGFAGQWCHMLEGQQDQRSELPQIRNEDNQEASTPGTITFSTPVAGKGK
ncbi:hypothetical protein PoB_004036400 [Plakobranchus ocellatus]|uniref:Delta-like protein n=1 Tax=Plakobranchus ocellatus TaxID=259542 RepID=A0AAV4B666_9GAST|nr:hypothetical protein PoB_004036400 [Plakobranchus ocellatus]